MLLQGTYTAMVTPFKNGGDVDFDALKRLIQEQANAGITGIVPCGTTGESPTLSHQEHREVIEKCAQWGKEARSDMVIIAGTGSNSTREAVELTKAAASYGADYALVVNPYYNKPTQEGLRRHCLEIADSSEIPLILYNIPGRTVVSFNIDTVLELSKHENIAGIKEATGDLNFMAQIIDSVDKNFSLLSGDDNLLLPILSIGGRGVISVISNIFPVETVEITKYYLEGNPQKSKEAFYRLFSLMRAMFLETNPIPVKYALSYQKKIENVLRLPMTPLSARFENEVREMIDKIEAGRG